MWQALDSRRLLVKLSQRRVQRVGEQGQLLGAALYEQPGGRSICGALDRLTPIPGRRVAFPFLSIVDQRVCQVVEVKQRLAVMLALSDMLQLVPQQAEQDNSRCGIIFV
jgi:hypothetical protein